MLRAMRLAGRLLLSLSLTAAAASLAACGDDPVDPFTVSLEPSGSNALTLTLAWADKTWSVDLNGPM